MLLGQAVERAVPQRDLVLALLRLVPGGAENVQYGGTRRGASGSVRGLVPEPDPRLPGDLLDNLVGCTTFGGRPLQRVGQHQPGQVVAARREGQIDLEVRAAVELRGAARARTGAPGRALVP